MPKTRNKQVFKQIIFKVLRHSGIPFLLREIVQRNKVSILMYHDPDPTAASEQFRYLKKHYNVIHLNEFIDHLESGKSLPPKSLVITFDDGHKGNFNLYPLFTQLQLPATIFLCSGIVDTQRHYWFLDSADSTKDQLKSLSNQERLEKLSQQGYDQEKEYRERQALNANEIRDMQSWVNFQSHTVYHPCLDQCTASESAYEITQSKVDLERKFNLDINTIAYPNGDYSQREIEIAREAGYRCALTVTPGYNTFESDPFTLKRLSTNDTTNMDEFIVRVSGLWGLIQALLSSGAKKEIRKHEHQDTIRTAATAG